MPDTMTNDLFTHIELPYALADEYADRVETLNAAIHAGNDAGDHEDRLQETITDIRNHFGLDPQTPEQKAVEIMAANL